MLQEEGGDALAPNQVAGSPAQDTDASPPQPPALWERFRILRAVRLIMLDAGGLVGVAAASDEHGGLAGGQRELHRTAYDRGMLDLRLQLIKMRTDYLNQINTQATLLAGCAVGMLASGELNALEEETGYFAWGITGVYVVSATVCLAASLWVIYTSMNLINLSIHSTLHGETMREIAEADNLIDQRMKEVRLVFLTSLASLIFAGLAMIVQMTHWPHTIIASFIFCFAVWHASTSDRGTVLLYQRYTGLQVKDRFNGEKWMDQARDLLMPFGIS